MRERSKVKCTSNPWELRGGFVVVKGTYFRCFLPDLWRALQSQGFSCEELAHPTTVSMWLCFINSPIFRQKDIGSGMSFLIQMSYTRRQHVSSGQVPAFLSPKGLGHCSILLVLKINKNPGLHILMTGDFW